jgi:hypothetical protein
MSEESEEYNDLFNSVMKKSPPRKRASRKVKTETKTVVVVNKVKESTVYNMSSDFKIKVIIGSVVLGVILLIMAVSGFMGSNDNENYQVVQSITGKMEVRDQAGWYIRNFAKVTTYPKSIQVFYNDDPANSAPGDDDSIRATFNDGGIADVSAMVRFRFPLSEDKRLMIHREFTANKENVVAAVRSHLLNSVKATATMMTATENQTSRKTEFNEVIGGQLVNGLYQMRRVEKTATDFSGKIKEDNNGKVLTTYATDVVLDEKTKLPKILQESPLKQYDIEVTQFSITSVDYDEATRTQFALKKDATLKTELAKVEVEQARMLTEKAVQLGLKTVAESQATANTEAAGKVIAAQRDKTLAEIEAQKMVAIAAQETLQAQQIKEKVLVEAGKQLAVAEITKKQAEVVASQELEVAKIQKEAAIENGKKLITLAEATQKQLLLAGNISEKEKVLATIAADRDVGIAGKLAGLKLPSQVIMTGGGNGGSGSDNLFNAMGVNATLDLMKKLTSTNSLGM